MADSHKILQWYIEAGVDEIILDTPQDRFLEVPPTPASMNQSINKTSPASVSSPALKPLPSALAGAQLEARALADAATSIIELENAIRSFNGCALKRTATNTVFADGDPSSEIMFIGEAPGADEDRRGIPFCGVSGQLLDAMIKAIRLDRTTAYITNTVYWRPPGNRQPSREELSICEPFVQKHIALVNPKLLVCVGGVAASHLLDTNTGVTRLRGKMHSYRTPYMDKDIPAAVLFHPSYLLRSPAQKRLAWQDLLAIKAFLAD